MEILKRCRVSGNYKGFIEAFQKRNVKTESRSRDNVPKKLKETWAREDAERAMREEDEQMSEIPTVT